MSNGHTPEQGIESNGRLDPSADLAGKIDFNTAAAAKATEAPQPQALALEGQYSSHFGHDARFGQVTNTEYKRVDGRTMALDTTKIRDAEALRTTAEMQRALDGQAEQIVAEAEAIAPANSAGIPKGTDNPEAAEVGNLDTQYAEAANMASAEIAQIDGDVGEELDTALAQAA